MVGAARSGTTMLRLMLDAHSELAIPPETQLVPELIEASKEDGADADGIAELLITHRRFPDFDIQADDVRARFAAIEPFNISDAIREFFRLYAEKEGKPRWGDKTPGYSRYIKKIHRHLPEARFIHLIRDGRDVTLSRTKTLALKDVPIAKSARRWKKRLKRAQRQGAKVDHYLELRYETLVSEPEATLRQICEFIELPWDDAILHHHERSEQRLSELDRDIPAMGGRLPRSAESRMALHERTTKPVDTAAIGKWRTQMPPEDVAEFESVAGDLLVELGYEPATPSSTPAE